MSEYTMAQFGSLSSGEANFASIYAQLTETISTLDSQLRTNLAEWDGPARDAYYVAKAQWDKAEANMALVLNNLRGVIGEASANYTQVEAANSALWNS
jgi:WXG100 family type VII secretion target